MGSGRASAFGELRAQGPDAGGTADRGTRCVWINVSTLTIRSSTTDDPLFDTGDPLFDTGDPLGEGPDLLVHLRAETTHLLVHLRTEITDLFLEAENLPAECREPDSAGPEHRRQHGEQSGEHGDLDPVRPSKRFAGRSGAPGEPLGFHARHRSSLLIVRCSIGALARFRQSGCGRRISGSLVHGEVLQHVQTKIPAVSSHPAAPCGKVGLSPRASGGPGGSADVPRPAGRLFGWGNGGRGIGATVP